MLERFHQILRLNQMGDESFDEWVKPFLENTELWPICKEGEVIGGVLFKGHTVHIAVHPDWHRRWATKAMFRAVSTWTHEVDIETSIRADNVASRKLAEKVGFVFHSDQGMYVKYVKPATTQEENHESCSL